MKLNVRVRTDLADYWRPIRRNWLVPVVATLIGAIVGLAYFAITPTSYTASTDVNVAVITTRPFTSDRAASGLLDAQTEAQIARSSNVSSNAAAELDSVSPGSVRSATQAVLLSNATIMRISFTSDSPESATAGAERRCTSLHRLSRPTR